MEPFDRCVGCNSTRLTAVETLPALIVGQHGSDQCCTSDVTHGGEEVLLDACNYIFYVFSYLCVNCHTKVQIC